MCVCAFFVFFEVAMQSSESLQTKNKTHEQRTSALLPIFAQWQWHFYMISIEANKRWNAIESFDSIVGISAKIKVHRCKETNEWKKKITQQRQKGKKFENLLKWMHFIRKYRWNVFYFNTVHMMVRSHSITYKTSDRFFSLSKKRNENVMC